MPCLIYCFPVTIGRGGEIPEPERRQIVEGVRAPVTIQQAEAVQELTRQEAETIDQTRQLVSLEPLQDVGERLMRAGIIPITEFTNLFRAGLRGLIPKRSREVEQKGFGVVPEEALRDLTPEELLETDAQKAAARFGGKLFDLPFVGAILETIGGYSFESAAIDNLQTDAGELRLMTLRVISEIANGKDIDSRLRLLETAEAGIRQKYNSAQVALRNSPQDIGEGLSVLDAMANDLLTVQERRFMER